MVQFIGGTMINLFPAPDGVYPLLAYQLVFALQAAVLFAIGIGYLGSRDFRLQH